MTEIQAWSTGGKIVMGKPQYSEKNLSQQGERREGSDCHYPHPQQFVVHAF
jgi:hypothetical protein